MRTWGLMLMALIVSPADANDRTTLAAYCLGSLEQGLQDTGPDTCAPVDGEICRTIAQFNADLRQRIERLRTYVGDAMRRTPADPSVAAAMHDGKVDNVTCSHSLEKVTKPIYDGTSTPSMDDLKAELAKPMATPACQRAERCNAPDLVPVEQAVEQLDEASKQTLAECRAKWTGANPNDSDLDKIPPMVCQRWNQWLVENQMAPMWAMTPAPRPVAKPQTPDRLPGICQTEPKRCEAMRNLIYALRIGGPQDKARAIELERQLDFKETVIGGCKYIGNMWTGYRLEFPREVQGC
jgi:hypothetical protein